MGESASQAEFNNTSDLYQFRLHRSGWGVGSGESGVGECGIIDLDLIVPMQPETILLIGAQKPGFSRNTLLQPQKR